HLDLEIESGEPVDTDCCPVWIRGVADFLVSYGQDRFELRSRIGMEGCHIDDIIEGASRRSENCIEIGEGKANLIGKVGFGRAVIPASDLTGDEEKVAGANCGRVAMLFVQGMPACWKNGVTLGHSCSFHSSALDIAIRLGWSTYATYVN